MPNPPLTHLGAIPVAQFMRRYWQRRPLLVRGAFANFVPPVAARVLFDLAGREEVESRLVRAEGGWDLRHGPLARGAIPPRRRPGWTLLVQGVDQHDDAAAALLARFRFIADARLDDLMMSYASDGGGVGPHIDDYDVFLLQAQGRRRWRIGRGDPRDFVPGIPLKVLRRFTSDHEWILEPGDVLYLPPGIAHEGTAVGNDCITCSIGFRAPQWRELLEPWLESIADRKPFQDRYRDRGASPARSPALLPAAFVASAWGALRRAQPTRNDARDLLLTYLTEPKANVVFLRAQSKLPASALRRIAGQRGLKLDRRSRMLYSGSSIAINGERLELDRRDTELMHGLADRRGLSPAQVKQLDAAAWRHVRAWHAAGWLHLA